MSWTLFTGTVKVARVESVDVGLVMVETFLKTQVNWMGVKVSRP